MTAVIGKCSATLRPCVARFVVSKRELLAAEYAAKFHTEPLPAHFNSSNHWLAFKKP